MKFWYLFEFKLISMKNKFARNLSFNYLESKAKPACRQAGYFFGTSYHFNDFCFSIYWAFILSESKLIDWILKMVMEKPMQFTIVSEVPRDSSGAFWATKDENKGESAITESPQINRKTMNWT